MDFKAQVENNESEYSFDAEYVGCIKFTQNILKGWIQELGELFKKGLDINGEKVLSY